nr:hypothetical protein [Tanacetum cinerariifolium]
MNLLKEGCSSNPPAQNQQFPGYSSQYASMTPEQFQQHQQEQQQAFFRCQQSQVLNREFQDLQQHPPSFNSETSQSLTQPQQVDSPKKGDRKKTKSKRGKNVEDEPVEAGHAWAILKFHPKWDAPELVDLTGDVPGATQEDLFGHDARPRQPGKPRPAKKTKSDVTTSTGGSSASTQFGELIQQELRLKREAAERAFEAQVEKDRTLMRLEELRFLATSTKDLDDDAYWIKKQKRLIKNKMRNDLGDEDDEDERQCETLSQFHKKWGHMVHTCSSPKISPKTHTHTRLKTHNSGDLLQPQEEKEENDYDGSGEW